MKVINCLGKQQLEDAVIGLLNRPLTGNIETLEMVVVAFNFAFRTHRNEYSDKEHEDLCDRMNAKEDTGVITIEIMEKLESRFSA